MTRRSILAIAVVIALALVYSIGGYLFFTADRADSATPCRSVIHRAYLSGFDEEQAAGIATPTSSSSSPTRRPTDADT